MPKAKKDMKTEKCPKCITRYPNCKLNEAMMKLHKTYLLTIKKKFGSKAWGMCTSCYDINEQCDFCGIVFLDEPMTWDICATEYDHVDIGYPKIGPRQFGDACKDCFLILKEDKKIERALDGGGELWNFL